MSERIFARTGVGTLAVDVRGCGAPVVLWHSLFADERSWQRLLPLLSLDRRLIVISGPGHGASDDPGTRYDLAACADAATEVLGHLGVAEPVDWVGNAWGGHVGVRFATSHAHLIRSLVTISSPIQALSHGERFQMTSLLVAYRVIGPARFIVDAVVEAMLAPATRLRDPEAVELLRASVSNADRKRLVNAVRSISLGREDLAPLLPRIEVPTLMITGADDRGWTPAQQDAAIAHVPDGRAAVTPNAAYLAPLEQPREIADLLAAFWIAVGAAPDGATR